MPVKYDGRQAQATQAPAGEICFSGNPYFRFNKPKVTAKTAEGKLPPPITDTQHAAIYSVLNCSASGRGRNRPNSGRSLNILVPQQYSPPRIRSEITESAAFVVRYEHAEPHQAREMQNTWRKGRNFPARDAACMQ